MSFYSSKLYKKGSKETIDFLKEELAGGPVFLTDINNKAMKRGLRIRTFAYAIKESGIKCEKKDGEWYLSLDEKTE